MIKILSFVLLSFSFLSMLDCGDKGNLAGVIAYIFMFILVSIFIILNTNGDER